MVGKFGPNKVFTTIEEEGEKNTYQSDAAKDFNNNRDQAKTSIDLLNIVGTFQAIFAPAPIAPTSPFKPYVRFYAEMPLNPPTPTNNQQDELVVNLEDSNLELDDLIIPSYSQGIAYLSGLLSLPRLSTRKKHGKKPLLDYSSSHLVTLNQYLAMLRQKALDKEVINKIREQKTKEIEEKKSKQVEHTFTQLERTYRRNVEKEDTINSF